MPTALWRGDIQSMRPMLATLEDAPLRSDALVYEPKYDGIRALVEIDPARRAPVRMWSRLGNDVESGDSVHDTSWPTADPALLV